MLVPVNQAAIYDCDMGTINVFLSFGGLSADQSPQRPPDLGRTIVWGHQDLTCDSLKTLEDKLFFGDICKVDFDIHISIFEAKKWSIILK